MSSNNPILSSGINMHQVVSSLFEGLVLVDAAKRITYMNQAAERLSGWTAAEALGKLCTDVFIVGSALGDQGAWDPVAVTLRDNAYHSLLPSSVLRRKDGAEIQIEDSVSPLRDADGGIVGAAVLFRDVTAARLLLLKALHHAHHDLLTELPNRRVLEDRMSQALVALHDVDRSVAVLFIDVDSFKEINDQYGHAVGDAALQALARRFSACMRRADTVSRLGGDEFVVLLPEVLSTEEALKIANRLLQTTSEAVNTGSVRLQLSISVGVAVVRHSCAVQSLLEDADAALYKAKKEGGNRVHLYTPSSAPSARRHLSFEEEMYAALEQDRFILHFQPQVDLGTGRVVGAEALVRWDMGGTLKMPGDFIPAAERTGLIIALGALVLRKAIRQQHAWREAGRGDLIVSVNVSAVELASPTYLPALLALVNQEDYRRGSILLELTETELLRAEEGRAILSRLYEEGFLIGIDDFGTGYSSVNYLREFPLDVIKIDRSFVAEATRSQQGLALVTAVAGMARTLGKSMVAEGIETEDQMMLMKNLGCELGQGYLFSRAVPADEFTLLM